jgi:hypothetical protein
MDATAYGGKTQIWNGANGQQVPPKNKLFETTYGEDTPNTFRIKVPEVLDGIFKEKIRAQELWDLGSGYIRMMPTLPL